MYVVVASEHEILRDALVGLLGAEPGFVVDGLAPDQATISNSPDVVLCSVNPTGASAVIRRLQKIFSDSKFVVLLLVENDSIAVSALECGVHGLVDLSAGAAELIQCIREAAAGEFAVSTRLARRLARLHGLDKPAFLSHPGIPQLTAREAEVLLLLAGGCSNRDIAARLSLSEHTVRAHLRVIMQKLNVNNRVQAASLAWQGNLISLNRND